MLWQYNQQRKKETCISASNTTRLVVEFQSVPVFSVIYLTYGLAIAKGECVCVLTAVRTSSKFSDREQKVSLYG